MSTAETATPTLEHAMDAAVEEHSKEQAGNESEAVPSKETGETEAGTTQQTQQTQQNEKAPDASAERAEEQLLSDEDFDKLRDDPASLRKAMNRAFTQKTQSLSE